MRRHRSTCPLEGEGDLFVPNARPDVILLPRQVIRAGRRAAPCRCVWGCTAARAAFSLLSTPSILTTLGLVRHPGGLPSGEDVSGSWDVPRHPGTSELPTPASWQALRRQRPSPPVRSPRWMLTANAYTRRPFGHFKVVSLAPRPWKS